MAPAGNDHPLGLELNTQCRGHWQSVSEPNAFHLGQPNKKRLKLVEANAPSLRSHEDSTCDLRGVGMFVAVVPQVTGGLPIIKGHKLMVEGDSDIMDHISVDSVMDLAGWHLSLLDADQLPAP